MFCFHSIHSTNDCKCPPFSRKMTFISKNFFIEKICNFFIFLNMQQLYFKLLCFSIYLIFLNFFNKTLLPNYLFSLTAIIKLLRSFRHSHSINTFYFLFFFSIKSQSFFYDGFLFEWLFKNLNIFLILKKVFISIYQMERKMAQ